MLHLTSLQCVRRSKEILFLALTRRRGSHQEIIISSFYSTGLSSADPCDRTKNNNQKNNSLRRHLAHRATSSSISLSHVAIRPKKTIAELETIFVLVFNSDTTSLTFQANQANMPLRFYQGSFTRSRLTQCFVRRPRTDLCAWAWPLGTAWIMSVCSSPELQLRQIRQPQCLRLSETGP